MSYKTHFTIENSNRVLVDYGLWCVVGIVKSALRFLMWCLHVTWPCAVNGSHQVAADTFMSSSLTLTIKDLQSP